MVCMECGAKAEKGYTTNVTDLGNCLLIVRNVPCYKCTECNEVIYTGDVIKRLEQITEQAKQFTQEISIVNYIENRELEPPFVCLVVSGGHSHLVVVRDYGEYEILGRTRDDAAGEAFDKVARAIGLGYPGGPKIDKVSRQGNPDAIKFPRAKVADAAYDFSFSGLKSAVLNYLNSCEMKGIEICQADVAASFQKAVVDVLVEHSLRALEESGMDKLAIAGGVASNSALREALAEACRQKGVAFYHPSPILCTDNAAMIGAAAYYEFRKGVRHGYDLNAVPNLKLGEKIG